MSKQVTTTKDFFEEIEEMFVKNEWLKQYAFGKPYFSEVPPYFSEVQKKMKHKGVHIRDVSSSSKLKAFKLELSKDLLVHLVLISLPTHFSQFKVSYYVKRTNGSLMSPSHIMCKKSEG